MAVGMRGIDGVGDFFLAGVDGGGIAVFDHHVVCVSGSKPTPLCPETIQKNSVGIRDGRCGSIGNYVGDKWRRGVTKFEKAVVQV